MNKRIINDLKKLKVKYEKRYKKLDYLTSEKPFERMREIDAKFQELLKQKKHLELQNYWNENEPEYDKCKKIVFMKVGKTFKLLEELNELERCIGEIDDFIGYHTIRNR